MKQHFLQAGLFRLSASICLAPVLIACGTVTRRIPTSDGHTVIRTNVEGRKQVNINTATPEELQTLPGVGKVIAERIVTYRDKYGYFRRPEHLMMVRGISDQKFRELQPLISFEAAGQSP